MSRGHLEARALPPGPARAYLAAIVESSVDAIKAKTLDGTITFWNQATERMYGYSAAEAIGRNVSFVIPPERPNELPEILARIARGERVEHYETERVRKDGTRIDVSLSVSPIRDESGAVVGAATIARDITERKRAERGQQLLATAAGLFAEARLDPAAILDGLCRAALETVADDCAVELVGEDGGALRPAATGDAAPALAGHPVGAGEGLAARVLRTGEPVLVPVVGPAPRRARTGAGHRPPADRPGSLLGVPMRAYGRTLGALLLGRRRAGKPFAEDDVSLVQEVAGRAAMALDAARVRADEERARREAEHLAAITRQLGHSLALGEVLDRVAGAAAELLASPVAGVFLLDAAADAFDLAAGRGLEGARTGRLRLPRDTSVAGRATATGRTVVVDDTRRERAVLPALVSGEPIGSLVVAPIGPPGAPVGVVEVYATRPAAFTARDATLLTALADAAGAAVANARLHRAASAARAEAEAERDRLRQVVEEMPEGVVVTDAGGRVVVSNPAARAALGLGWLGLGPLDPAPLAGGPTAAPARRPDGGPVAPADLPVARALARGESVRGEQLLVRHASQEGDVALLVSATPLRGPDGAVEGAVAIFRDVTAILDLERERDAMLAAAAHDLKNPLSAVKGAAQVLLRALRRAGAVPPERLGPSLALIEETATRMANSIDELLDATRLRLGQPLSLDRRPTDLVALARRQAAAFQAATEAHRIEVDAAAPALVGDWDEARLARVVGNLLSNTVKYSPGGGLIRVEVDTEGEESAVLRVRDEGVGIPAADLGRVFDRFGRASNVAGVSGSGIGLAGARQIVEQHGGSIGVESTEGAGATFTVRLPMRRPDYATGGRAGGEG
jgi:PAS domain S-box-containing protein